MSSEPIPNLFLVGAPKCGTTALATYLSEHPDVWLSRPKEPHFFMPETSPMRRISDPEHYRRLFRNGRDHTITADASVWYLFSQGASRRIASWNPQAKILIMLRSPADFVASLHSQLIFSGVEREPDLRSAWERGVEEERRIAPAGFDEAPDGRILYPMLARFAPHVERYMNTFGRQNVMVVLQEDLNAAPAETYQRVLRFLELRADDREDFRRVNANKAHRSAVVKRLLWALRSNPALGAGARAIKRTLGIGTLGVAALIQRMNSVERSRAPLDPATRRMIEDALRDEAARTSELLGRDLVSVWRGGVLNGA